MLLLPPSLYLLTLGVPGSLAIANIPQQDLTLRRDPDTATVKPRAGIELMKKAPIVSQRDLVPLQFADTIDASIGSHAICCLEMLASHTSHCPVEISGRIGPFKA